MKETLAFYAFFHGWCSICLFASDQDHAKLWYSSVGNWQFKTMTTCSDIMSTIKIWHFAATKILILLFSSLDGCSMSKRNDLHGNNNMFPLGLRRNQLCKLYPACQQIHVCVVFCWSWATISDPLLRLLLVRTKLWICLLKYTIIPFFV